MARLESGRVRFRFERFQLAELIAECIDIVQPQAAERGRHGTAAGGPGAMPGQLL